MLEKWCAEHGHVASVRFVLRTRIDSGFAWTRQTPAKLVISSISDVCHLSDGEITLLEAKFQQYCGYMDHIKVDELCDQLAKFIAPEIARGLTTWADQNHDAKIDFREYCFAISSITKGAFFKYLILGLR